MNILVVDDDRIVLASCERVLTSVGHEVSLEEVIRDVVLRDRQDSEREIAPLRPSEDGVLVDSTGKSIEDVVEEMLRAIKRRKTAKL